MSSSPLTLTDWRQAYAAGAKPGALLGSLLRRVRADSPASVWIHLASEAELAA